MTVSFALVVPLIAIVSVAILEFASASLDYHRAGEATLREREREQAEKIFASESAKDELDVSHKMLRQLEQSWYNYVQAGRFSGV